MNSQTVVADIADELARRVAAGEYAPGDLVPSVRQVAAEFEVNRATAQLILGRLESTGFVEAKRGKGFTVRDVRLVGGVDVYRRLFRLSVEMPEVALETFRDLVQLEQMLLLDTMRAYSAGDHRIAQEDLHAAVERLAAIAREPDPDLAEFLGVELGVVRSLVGAVGNGMHLAVLNSIGEMVLGVWEATSAFFAVPPDVHVAAWRAVVTVWENGGAPSESEAALFEDLVTRYHRRVLTRFGELLAPAERAVVASAS